MVDYTFLSVVIFLRILEELLAGNSESDSFLDELLKVDFLDPLLCT